MSEISDATKVDVQNLVDHIVVFTDADNHRRYSFQPFEKKTVAAGVLRQLNYSYGGSVLLKNFLSVKNADLAKEFGVDPDETIEYNWTEKDVDNLLTSGSVDELLDALEFGPEGIQNLIIDKAVETKLNDMEKRKAIFDMTGKDINQMISLREQSETKSEDSDAPKKARRVAKKKTTTKSTGRRTNTSTKKTEE